MLLHLYFIGWHRDISTNLRVFPSLGGTTSEGPMKGILTGFYKRGNVEKLFYPLYKNDWKIKIVLGQPRDAYYSWITKVLSLPRKGNTSLRLFSFPHLSAPMQRTQEEDQRRAINKHTVPFHPVPIRTLKDTQPCHISNVEILKDQNP